MSKLLQRYAETYYDGLPLIDDATYDYLEDTYGRNSVGSAGEVPHMQPMLSLDKVYVGEKLKLQRYNLVETLKLDGLAISLLYDRGILVRGLTRGDGVLGKDITAKVLLLASIPYTIDTLEKTQISGEVVCPKEVPNARNFASGAMSPNTTLDKFKTKADQLSFIAYGATHLGNLTYKEDMLEVASFGITTVLAEGLEDLYRSDGRVFRVNSNIEFNNLGYTSTHPKGAYALKDKSDIAIEEAELLRVEWQVGSSGKVTPVGHFTEVIIDDAKITKATLYNAGRFEDLELSIGDTILVTRAGGVIPQIIGKK